MLRGRLPLVLHIPQPIRPPLVSISAQAHLVSVGPIIRETAAARKRGARKGVEDGGRLRNRDKNLDKEAGKQAGGRKDGSGMPVGW